MMMFDLQKLVDAMNETASAERSKYQMTLGGLISVLEGRDPKSIVEYDDGSSPSEPHSYRGYYTDLSFEPSGNVMTAGRLLKEAKEAIGETFEGYKGGDFSMHANTPLWASPYGSANGVAIMGSIVSLDGKLILNTKIID